MYISSDSCRRSRTAGNCCRKARGVGGVGGTGLNLGVAGLLPGVVGERGLLTTVVDEAVLQLLEDCGPSSEECSSISMSPIYYTIIITAFRYRFIFFILERGLGCIYLLSHSLLLL